MSSPVLPRAQIGWQNQDFKALQKANKVGASLISGGKMFLKAGTTAEKTLPGSCQVPDGTL